jgi:hypothetical protein
MPTSRRRPPLASPDQERPTAVIEVAFGESRRYVGELINHPYFIPRLGPGDPVKFTADDIIDVAWGDESDDRLPHP